MLLLKVACSKLNRKNDVIIDSLNLQALIHAKLIKILIDIR